MKQVQDDAFVLKQFPYGESDLIVHLLTYKSGRVTCFAPCARKSKKRFNGSIDYGNWLWVTLGGRSTVAFKKLRQAELKRFYSSVRDDIATYAAIQYLLELVSGVVPEGSDTGSVFKWLAVLYQLMEAHDDIPKSVLIVASELTLLAISGFGINFEQCDHCGESDAGRLVFSPADGGVVCRHFRAGSPVLEIHPGTVMTLRQIVTVGLSDTLRRIRMARLAVDEYRKISVLYLDRILSKPLITRDYMESCL